MKCQNCGKELEPVKNKSGEVISWVHVETHVNRCEEMFAEPEEGK